MRLLPAAEFRTDIPDDEALDQNGRTIAAGGPVAAALRLFLEGQGFSCDPPQDGGDHGWQFLCRSRGRDLWVSVIGAGGANYYVTIQNMPWTPLLFWKDRPSAFDRILIRFDEAMKVDGRFHDIRWGREEDLFSGTFRASTPLG